MRRIGYILLILIMTGTYSCTDAVGSQEGNVTVSENGEHSATLPEESGAEPEYLTYDTFKEKVWNFEENPQEWVYEGDVPCVIDFYADWCKPCRMVAPIMDDLAKEYDGKLKIYKIDVDKEKQLASIFQVRSIPAVLFSPVKGRPMMQAGALPKDQYVRIIEENLMNQNESK
ncbi:MAG: thioredoxin [bacterium]|jgi:thioredoxin 1